MNWESLGIDEDMFVDEGKSFWSFAVLLFENHWEMVVE